MANKKLAKLQNDLEKLAKGLKVESSDYVRNDNLQGLYLLGEGYEHITYPGTAHVRQYRLFNDGVLKINIFMGEESSTVESTLQCTIPVFMEYLQQQSKKSLEEVIEAVAEAKK